MKQWLEMEIGITGGEEDGVDNEGVDNASLYTQPEDIYNIYKELSSVSPYFSIAYVTYRLLCLKLTLLTMDV